MSETAGSGDKGPSTGPATAPKVGYSFASIHEVHTGEVPDTTGDDWSIKALVSVIIGIIGLVLVGVGLIMPYIGWTVLIIAPIGIIIAVLARSRYKRAGYGRTPGTMMAGLILNGIALLLIVVVMVLTSF